MGLKLDLGCGRNKISGYIGVDWNPEYHPDIVCDLTKQCPAADNSVEAVFCSHTFEHFTKEEQSVFLTMLLKICQIGARIEFRVPLNFKDPAHPVILGYDWIQELCRALFPNMALYEYKVENITTTSILPGEEGRRFTYEQATAVFKMMNRDGIN